MHLSVFLSGVSDVDVKEEDVIKGHVMSVSTKDKHSVVVHKGGMTISC